ncbi:MAG: YggT family protein [Phormidesmis sp. RL_2_1]|nr:YggT family protein [Phormidesmis sp. RL_2_1]
MSNAAIATWIFGLLLSLYTLLFLFRIILTWYPEVDLNRFPFVIAVWPTEPFLIPTRQWVAPIGGVDISPVIWVGIVSFLREILVGQQGLLRMMG